ncbi:phospholipase A [uncultured Desulfobacter sp.]|uniref:phospholipase A n=1 Tax=uncultured Desulfobacter sp. TaxID=240139 RepID=UPI002AAB2504|nr:phospholipase A [uncultured Desulfobacter sp.]
MKLFGKYNGISISQTILCLWVCAVCVWIPGKTDALWAADLSCTMGTACSFVLVAPDSTRENPLPSGRETRIRFLFTNDEQNDLTLPDQVSLTFSARGVKPIAAQASLETASPSVIKAHGFGWANYIVKVPGGLSGLVTLQDSEKKGNAVNIYTDFPRECVIDGDAPDPRPFSMYESLFQPFFVNFSSYKPVYFLFGVEPNLQATTFQLSFKYRLFNFEEENWFKNCVEKIRMAYTQQSFWDLGSDSAPFEDSRYMPELFYYEDDLGIKLPYLLGSGFLFGYQHESNGRAGDDSRSTNYIYFQPVFVFHFCGNLMAAVKPKVWAYVNNNETTNGDLPDYRGYFDLETTIGHSYGLALTSHYRHGAKGPTIQLDLSYPMNRIPYLKRLLNVYVYARYSSGYSEQMLKYDRRADIFCLGLALTR